MLHCWPSQAMAQMITYCALKTRQLLEDRSMLTCPGDATAMKAQQRGQAKKCSLDQTHFSALQNSITSCVRLLHHAMQPVCNADFFVQQHGDLQSMALSIICLLCKVDASTPGHSHSRSCQSMIDCNVLPRPTLWKCKAEPRSTREAK